MYQSLTEESNKVGLYGPHIVSLFCQTAAICGKNFWWSKFLQTFHFVGVVMASPGCTLRQRTLDVKSQIMKLCI